MIDKGAYIGMNGAQTSLRQLEIITNNLANINTTGFRADHQVTKPFNLTDDENQARVYSQIDSTYSDFKPGSVINTGRDLDVAIAGDGFFAIQNKSGQEGYTRAGSFEVNKDGMLVTKKGELVLGLNGVITIPQVEKMSISPDGTITGKYPGSSEMVVLSHLKLINPPINQLHKGDDGLFYTLNNSAVPQDPKVKLTLNSVEGSNVNAIEALTSLIDISRHYQMHTNMLQSMSDNAGVANKILELPR